MTNEDANLDRDDVTEGWPDEGGNAELAQFARNFARSIPQLSPQAIDRVHERMLQSRRRARAGGPWAGVLAGLSAAAAILLAIGLWHAVATCRPAMPEPPVATQTPVQDTFTVAFTGLPSPKSPDRPLVNLGEVESLVSPIR